jgi:hypothetical protein
MHIAPEKRSGKPTPNQKVFLFINSSAFSSPSPCTTNSAKRKISKKNLLNVLTFTHRLKQIGFLHNVCLRES